MSLTLGEARARATLISDLSYAVQLDLTEASTSPTFGMRTTVSFRSSWPETFLELAAACDLEVTVNGEALARPSYDGHRIHLTDLRESNVVVVEARLPYVTDGDGMHRFADPADGELYVSAYCGMDIAQRVFACFDQNDLKAPITLQVRAEPTWTVLANGATAQEHEGTWEFATTAPIPVAMFVVCAGPWHSVRWEHAGLGFGWHARRSLAAELERDAAELRSTTQNCFDHYGTLFDEPYPFDSYDQVFVPGQNWGALETPGCVTYRDEYLPRERITQLERTRRAVVIAHEMAHMWFGNLVTMRWWEDTWLQESFADYMGYRVAQDGAGFRGTLVWHESHRKPGAYEADERPSTHAVAPAADAVPNVDAAFTNFDAISYAKGNSVLRQLATWLGDEEFLAGLNQHLTRHRFGNATLDDFVEALDAASSRDVRGWVKEWLRTSGFDALIVKRDEDVPYLVREGHRHHRLRVTAYDEAMREHGSRMVDLAAAPVRFDDWAGLVVVPNSHGETFARVRLDAESTEAVDGGLCDLHDDLARAVLWAANFDRVRSEEITPDDYLDLVARHLPTEHDAAILDAVLHRTLNAVVPRQVEPERAAQALDVVAAACRAGLASTIEGQLVLAFTRGLAVTDRDAQRLRGWLSDGRTDHGVPLDPTTRWKVVRRLAQLDAITESDLAAEEADDPTAAGRLAAATARAARPTPAAKEAAWQAMVGDDQVSNRMFEALASGLWSVEHADLVAPYVARYFRAAPAIAERRGQAFSQVLGRAFPRVHLDQAQIALLGEALTGEVPTVLRRDWQDHYDDLVRVVE
ncbi:aminopeptidase N [Nocardioides sp.]|uniref:aminopeptidase N n=1 Tax=Nocardioides sp. TaxID=35761 RepID=UPI00356944E7